MSFRLLLAWVTLISAVAGLINNSEEWASPEIQPIIMEQFSASVHKAHQTLVKQQAFISNKISACPTLRKALAMVSRVRMGLDCGSAAPSGLLGDLEPEVVVEATGSCIRSEKDFLCLVRKLHNFMRTKSLEAVCSALREVESGVKTALGIFCPEELLQVTPVLNVQLDQGTPHFIAKHRSAPPAEQGTAAGEIKAC
eukprot:TRINITY_DN13323_c0_g3_i1.p1 TRINITY_DN13323_c0_g3~~TRINITY_DN13323_c0_g3_i1.p1  ORF type:complete len:197 (+),score=43.19 TRINITY_DN13323_c0_g3_i1:71-661(+)